MIVIVYLLIPVLFSVEWLSQVLGVIPPMATIAPDVLSVIAGVAVGFGLSTGRSINMAKEYWIGLTLLVFLITGGIVINYLEPWIVINGLRAYLKFLPFFLLPIVFQFSDQQIMRCLKLLLVLGIVQLPVAVYQRFVLGAGINSGDMVGGTLGVSTSGVLSVFLCCSVAILMGFYARKRISVGALMMFSVLLLIPTAINETKISVLMIPFVFLAPMFLAARSREAARRLMGISVMVGIVLAGFTTSYNYFIGMYRTEMLFDFLSDRERLEGYVYKGADSQYDAVGRVDSILLAQEALSRDGKLIFGVGIGNASDGPTQELTGEYFSRFWRMEPTKTFLTKIFWEMGIVGPLVYIALMVFVMRTAYRLRGDPTIVGAIAIGWVPVTMILAGSFIYFKTFDRDIFTCLFWLFSGYLVSYSARSRRANGSSPSAA